jgi:hypothetical protein
MTGRGWALLRASWLLLAVVLLSPISPLVLVGVPLALLLLAFCNREVLALVVAAVVLATAFTGLPDAGRALWIAERGWALLLGGAFVLTTLARPRDRVISRALYAVAAVFAVIAVHSLFQPGLASELDWWIASELRDAAGRAYDAISTISASGQNGWVERFGATVFDWAEVQVVVYPAFLALASIAALEVGWFVVARFWGTRSALGPLKDFRFSDQLVWVLIGGLALLVLPIGGLAGRVGENAMLFMGGLYLVRGIAVMAWLAAATITSTWVAALWAICALLLYPMVAGAALAIGLSDTWLDLRARLRHSMMRRQ